MREFMIHVERAVRPVRAGARRKDRIREELLAHLKSIYEEELGLKGDQRAAWESARARFGDPAKLAHALQAGVSFPERAEFSLERLLGWRAPESAARYTLRTALLTFAFGSLGAVLLSAAMFVFGPKSPDLGMGLRLGGTFLIVSSLDIFLLGLLYFKTRDALCGAPWAPRSYSRVLMYAFLFGAVILGSGMLIPWIGIGKLTGAFILLPHLFPVALASCFAPVLFARFLGAAEIRHTEWACLDISDAAA